MDPELEPLFGHRDAAGQLIGDNILTLKQLTQGGYLSPHAAAPTRGPPVAAPSNDESGREWGWRAGSGVLAGAEKGLDRAGKWMAPRAATRLEHAALEVAHGANGAPGAVADLANVLTSDNKARALAGVAGSRAGAELGAALTSEFPPAIPLGAFAGSMAGDWAGTALYDHGPQIADALRAIPVVPDALPY